MSSSQPEPDIFARMRARRVVFVRDPLDAAEANRIIAELLHLEGDSAGAEITLRLNCATADLQAALGVYDTMQMITAPVATLCAGTAAGAAVLLLAAGAPGRRAATASSQIRLQQPSGRLAGRTRELDMEARRLLRLRAQLHELLAKHTGQPAERIERDTDRGLILSAEEARAYGLIDQIAGEAGAGSVR